MIKIALCDDNVKDLEEMVEKLQCYDKNKIFSISTFYNAESFYNTFLGQSFDIVIMDIIMDPPNGYEIAKRIHAHSTLPLIIFVSESMSYSIRGYGVAFRYLPKPLDYHSFSETLDAAIQEITANQFVIPIEGSIETLNLAEIFFFESRDHHTLVHTYDKKYILRSSLKGIMHTLPQGRFCTPHKGYIVNLSHIKMMHSNVLLLSNGATIPLSRRRRQEFSENYLAFLRREP